ncbi:MAG: hypothetical protein GY820_45040 [Gammaproteobacteria bacterium]|nr:hypothetical protein [Gammaproteobacteria bacterium]
MPNSARVDQSATTGGTGNFEIREISILKNRYLSLRNVERLAWNPNATKTYRCVIDWRWNGRNEFCLANVVWLQISLV